MTTHCRLALAGFVIVLAAAWCLEAGGVFAGPGASRPAVRLDAGTLGGPDTPTPSEIVYQGRLWDDQQGDWVNGRRDVAFSLWDDAVAGNRLWTEPHTDVVARNGLFQVTLGVDQVVFTGQALWLEVQVDGDAEPMRPRTPLLPVPYALGLVPAATVAGDTDVPMLRVTNDGDAVGRLDIASHGIQASSAVTGTAGLYAKSFFGYGVHGSSQANTGVFGYSGRWFETPPRPTGRYGVMGRSQQDAGVLGHTEDARAPGVRGTGTAVGVHGQAMTGVLGDGDVGVRGNGMVGVAGDGTTGVSGTGTGAGVNGEGGQVGVQGLSPGVGVSGRSTGTASTSIGVSGSAVGQGAGVKGTAVNGHGGTFWSTGNVGVVGLSSASAITPVINGHHGVYGAGQSAAGDYGGYFVGGSGVYGKEMADTAASYAGRFDGDVLVGDSLEVTGTATFHGAKTGYVVDICVNADDGILAPGDVVVVTGVAPAVVGDVPVMQVRRARRSGDAAVVGVVDQRFVPPDAGGGSPRYLDRDVAPGEHLTVVTLGAYKRICVDAGYGPIHAGDLLTASATAGCAMRADDPRPGAVIGKALDDLAEGIGAVPVLVSLR